MTVRLRPMRWWDVETLLPTERELFGAEAWSAETWWAELAAPGRSYVLAERAEDVVAERAEDVVAEREPELLGYAGVLVTGSDADVMTVAVAPGSQGRGLGATLLGRLVELAVAAGAEQLLLEVRGDNVPAQRLYSRMGFERIAVRRGYYRTPEGAVDAWIMRRRPLVAAHTTPVTLPS